MASKPKKAKKPKDPNAPKRPQSAFFMFSNERRTEMKSTNSGSDLAEISKQIGSEWKQLDIAKKKAYQDRASKAMDEYKTKIAEWKLTVSNSENATLQKTPWTMAAGTDTKKPKDHNAPKRSQTAYSLYSHSIRSQLVSEFPDKKSNEIAKMVSTKWKDLSVEEKTPFIEEAKKLKKEYQSAMEKHKQTEEYKEYRSKLEEWNKEYGDNSTASSSNRTSSSVTTSKSVSLSPLKMKPKDTNAPKRPLSAYVLFTNSIRDSVRSEYPEKKMIELSKIFSMKWKELSDHDKAPYVEEAQRLKSRYNQEMERYKQTDEYKQFQIKAKEWKKEHGTHHEVEDSDKKPKDPNAPRKPHTAFYLFSHLVRDAMKRDFPGKKSSEISKLIAAKWKSLSDEGKAPFIEQSKTEKMQYQEQMKEYMQTEEYETYRVKLEEWQKEHGITTVSRGSTMEPAGPPKKPKDLNAPKRPMTAYFLFLQNVRSRISSENPDKKTTEIAKIIGEEWHALSEEDKAPFLEEAQELKDQYQEAMERHMETEEYKLYRERLEEWEKEYGKKAIKEKKTEEEKYVESVSDANARFLFGPRFRAKMSN